ncbi:MAG TPA: ribonuclease III [Acidimicrobiales bacterium]|nr:ribonuclease III [Acidimicrobiales bacterium]
MGVPAATPEDLAAALGLKPDDGTLEIALTHSSYAAEHHVRSNERLEFLGDAVVGLIIAERSYRELDMPEGGLAQVRQATVSSTALASASRDLGIDAALRLGRGEEASGGRTKDSVLADAYEAVVAAVYLDGGLDAARRVVLSSLDERFTSEAAHPGASDVKSRLQEWSEATGLGTPVYEVQSSGPSHEQRFIATVTFVHGVAGTGEGSSKKAAELEAARAAWEDRDA